MKNINELELYKKAKQAIEEEIKISEKQITNLQNKITNDKARLKLISSLIALTTSVSSTTALAQNIEPEIQKDITHTQLDTSNIESNEKLEITSKALKSVYKRQMEYLYPTIQKLKELFSETPELKNNFEKINRIISIDLNCYVVSLGGKGSYEYYIKSGSIPDEISKNDVIIADIYDEYKNNIDKIIDKKIKKQFEQIIGKNINYSHSELLTGEITRLINNNELYTETLRDELINVYNNQTNFINDTKNELKKFYSNKEKDKFIKKYYNDAYESYNKKLENINYNNKLSNHEQIDLLLQGIIDNNITIYNFRIKPLTVNARNTDFGMITDKEGKSRLKTEEDIKIINEYSKYLEDYMYYVPNDLLNLYDFANKHKDDYIIKTNSSSKK